VWAAPTAPTEGKEAAAAAAAAADKGEAGLGVEEDREPARAGEGELDG
jgi:hypothetical protein